MRRSSAVIVLLALVVVGGGVAWFGGDSEPPPEASASDDALVDAMTAGSAQAEAELERRERASEGLSSTLGTLRARGLALKGSGESVWDRLHRVDRLERRALKYSARKTAVDRALAEIPLKRPPLHIRQWVTTDTNDDLVGASASDRKRFYAMPSRERLQRLVARPEHKVYARVKASRWYAMSLRARKRAVKRISDAARRAFASQGVHDLVLVVAPLTERVDRLPPLAIGRNGSASLTALGRGDARLEF